MATVARRHPARHRGPAPRWRAWLPAATVVIVTVFVVGTFAILGRTQGAPQREQAAAAVSNGAAIVRMVTSVKPDVLDAIGSGGLTDPLLPTRSSTSLVSSGKPLVLYVGADYCPYCASERWSVIVALSRFGTFSDLGFTRSSGTDVYPNTATFSFRGASYASDYVAFVGIETADREGKPFPNAPVPPASFARLDPVGSIPFVDLGDRYVQLGSGYRPEVLVGKGWQDIATTLDDPRSPTARAILGNANYLTAAICELTNGLPARVCDSPALRSLQRRT